MRRLNLTGLVLAVLLLALPLTGTQAQKSRSVAASATTALAPVTVSPAERAAAERITTERLKEILYFIASDEMAGRDTPSPGLDKTAQFIADRLKQLKLKPAGDKDSFFQRISLSKTIVDREATQAQLGERVFKLGEDFLPAGRVGGDADAPLIYVGHGWVIKSKGINAYEGLDVRDRVVIVSGDGTTAPAGMSVAGLAGGDWESPLSYAQKHGAKALIIIPRNYERSLRAAGLRLTRPYFTIPRLENAAAEDDEDDSAEPPTQGMPTILPTRSMLDALFAGEQLDAARLLEVSNGTGEMPKGFALSSAKRLRVSVKLSTTEATTQNIVAVLEGKDSKLKKEYVALGAHYDHVGGNGGGCRPVGGDSICNGADDDGSGTTALLTMAEAFAGGKRPKRSILFVWHAGEEKGLWGSEYFTRYPTVPLKQIVAQLNIDMIGRSKKADDTKPANKMLTGPEEIYVIGSRMMSAELAGMSEGVNRAYLNLKFNYHYDEPSDPERLFYRSDHYNYARKGVPIIFYFDGVHEDYHRPTDSPDKIDYEKMQKVARTVFILANELADAPRRPVVDKQLPADRLNR